MFAVCIQYMTDGLMSAVERNAQRDKGFATVFFAVFQLLFEIQ
jgi:hypothetical protein